MRDLDLSDIRTLQPTTSVEDPERVLARQLARDVRPTDDAETSRAPARTFSRQIDCSPDSARDRWGAASGRCPAGRDRSSPCSGLP
jgi:hypothetical protein